MKRNIYSCDETFFENTKKWEEKHAYFLGWLMSDGHHDLNKGSISIRLQEKDKRILEILRDIIKYNGNLGFVKRNGINDFIKKSTNNYQNRWNLHIYNRKLSKDLLNLKIDNHKTNNLEFPIYIEDNLISHFLRSFYEGDGTISYSMYDKNKIMRFSLNVIATKPFINYLKEFLSKKLKIESTILNEVRIKNGNVILRISGLLNALIFFNYTYRDANFVLKRKFRKFLRLINHLKRKTNWHSKIQEVLIKEQLNNAMYIANNIIKYAKY